MTVRAKVGTVFASLAIFGGREILLAIYEPVFKGLGQF